MLRKKLWLLALMMMLVGCGGAATAKRAQAPQSGFAQPEATGGRASVQSESEPSAPATPPAASPAPAPGAADAPAKSTASVDAQGRTEDSRAAESRPGLGTEWGESRTSRVHDVAFVRDAGRPFAIAQFNYNDRRGVDALVAAQGRRDSSRGIDTAGGAVTVSLRDPSGAPLEAIRAGGRTFVVGQAGERYSIVLENHTSHRFEAVATVDGLDVINGRDGSFENRGYVLMPFATLEIEGFRQSAQSVAAFRFAAVSDSYATQRGKPRNIGAIGVAFFSERGDSFVPNDDTRIRNTASPFPADPRFAPPPPR
jgi:hypothetical protein